MCFLGIMRQDGYERSSYLSWTTDRQSSRAVHWCRCVLQGFPLNFSSLTKFAKLFLQSTIVREMRRKIVCCLSMDVLKAIQSTRSTPQDQMGIWTTWSVEAHPQLTTGTLYRSSDSAMTMKRAREVLLFLPPEGFKISLSSCYNYTENYRKGSAEAKQHKEHYILLHLVPQKHRTVLLPIQGIVGTLAFFLILGQ